MSGLNAALSVASGALSAQEAGLETINNNIANANTPGYSRETVQLSAASAVQSGNISLGGGVSIDGVASVRDQLLSLQVQQQTSAQASASAQNNVLTSLAPYFSGTSTVGSQLSSFFTKLSALSSAPSDAATRQTAMSAAGDLVTQFNNTSSAISSAQSGLGTQIATDVTKINSLATQIAALNTQVAEATAGGKDGGSALDKRSSLEEQLAGLTDIAITNTAEGDTITVAGGSALVVAGRSLPLSVGTAPSGLLQVNDSTETNITGKFSGGDLGGLLQVRDTILPGFTGQLDTLANGFAKAVNAAQTTGFDINGNPGTALFQVPSSVAGSAAAITLAVNDGSALAISSDGSPGSNGNLSKLTGVQGQALANGINPTGSFAALVSSVGNATSQASTQSTALQSSLTQLQNQQNSVSGVSLDEESSNLIRYQQAYEAAAEVITTIRSLFSDTLNMMSGAGA